MCKNGKCICMVFGCFMMFLICCFGINFSLEETDSTIFQTEDKKELDEWEDKRTELENGYYHVADDAEEKEENGVSQSLTERIGYLEDQEIGENGLENRKTNLENKYYHSVDGGEEKEEKRGSDSLTEQVAYLIDQNIDEIGDME